MSRTKDWVWMRGRHLSEALSWVKVASLPGNTGTETFGGWESEDHFHSGYVEFRVAPRYPAGLWDWSSGERYWKS